MKKSVLVFLIALVFALILCLCVRRRASGPMQEINEDGDGIFRGLTPSDAYPRLAILMWWDSEIDDYANLTWEINCAFGRHRGIDVIRSNKVRDHRASNWQRIKMMKRYIEEYDYVIWCDADAAFNDHSSSVKAFMHLHDFPDAFLSDDLAQSWNHEMSMTTLSEEEKKQCNVNSGVIMVRNSDSGKKLLDLWGSSEHSDDQSALRLLYHKHLSDSHQNLGHVVKVPYGVIQIFPHLKPPRDITTPRHEKDEPFIYHMAGTDHNQRLIFFSKLKKHHRA